MEQAAIPVSFLDHLRQSAKSALSEPSPVTGNSRQLSTAVQRALQECLGSDLEFKSGTQQILSVPDWISSLDSGACLIAHCVEEQSDETALIAFDRRTAILLATFQFGGASMLGLTDTGRALSAIEQEYLIEFGKSLFPTIRTDASGSASVNFVEPQTAAANLPLDCMLTCFDFTIGLNDIRLNFVLATSAQTALSKAAAPDQTQADSAWKSAISSELTRSNVRLEAVVDLAPLTLSRLRMLIPGDIIAIPEGALGRTALVSRGETLLTGRLGKFGGSYTVRITSAASSKTTPLQGAIANTQRRKR